MTSDKARLRRSRLIERVRTAEQRRAAGKAHRAEAVRQKLEQLSERTRSLAEVYAIRDSAHDGADLRNASILGAHLRELGRTAERQADRARQEADERLLDLAAADRGLERAEDARRALQKEVSGKADRLEIPTTRRTGTHLE